jgi:hypothetical protein
MWDYATTWWWYSSPKEVLRHLALFFIDNLNKEDDEHSIGVVQPLCHWCIFALSFKSFLKSWYVC